ARLFRAVHLFSRIAEPPVYPPPPPSAALMDFPDAHHEPVDCAARPSTIGDEQDSGSHNSHKRIMSMKSAFLLSAFAAAAISLPAPAPAKSDLPTAYHASNLPTENLQQFVKEVKELSGGEFDITLHLNASLFKAPEIKRAVQSNQAQAGEILLTNYAN